MANYASLKAAIQQVVKTNGNNEITGALLQQSVLAMVNSLGAGYQFVGIATPITNPGTPDQNVFYIAGTAGTYSNFGGIVVADGEFVFLKYNGTWSKDSTGAASLEKLNQLGQEVTNIGHKVDGNEFALFNEGKLSAKVVVDSYIDENTGEFVGYNGYKRTSFINVRPFSKIKISATHGSIYGAIYGVDKQRIKRLSLVAGSFILSVTDEMYYIAVSDNAQYFDDISFEIVEYKVDAVKEQSDKDAQSIDVLGNVMFGYKLPYYNGQISSSGNWGSTTSSASYYVIAIPASSKIVISTDVSTRFTLLKSFVPYPSSAADYATGYGVGTDNHPYVGLTAYNSITINAPADANYLYVARYYANGERTPKSIVIDGVDILQPNGYPILLSRLSSLEKNPFNGFSTGQISYTIKTNTYINKNDGTEVEYSGWKASEMINIGLFSKIKVTNGELATSYNAFYDVNGTFIGNFNIAAGGSDIDVPLDAVFARISNTDKGFAAMSVYALDYSRGGGETDSGIIAMNDPQDMVVKLQQLKQPAKVNGVSQTAPITMLNFTDIHGSGKNLQRIVDFISAYESYIDVSMHTGDSVQIDLREGAFDFWANISGAAGILNVVGNHDAKDSVSGYVPQIDVYNTIFAPYISSWDVIQPANAATNGYCYYYKDFVSASLRLIVLDCIYWDNTQQSWFESVVDDALTKNLSLIVAVHYPVGYTTPIDCNFLSLDYLLEDGARFNNGIAKISEFITNGGDFVCWISGHTHSDGIGKVTYQSTIYDAQLNIIGDTARFGPSSAQDRASVNGTKSMDCFNIFAFDTYSKLIKVVRVGCNYDRHLRHIGEMCYDYAAKKVLYSR